jgi:hypothetical protein
MNLEHTVFIYVSLETEKRQRLTLSKHLELPALSDMAKRLKVNVIEPIKVQLQLVTIGFKALTWALI